MLSFCLMVIVQLPTAANCKRRVCLAPMFGLFAANGSMPSELEPAIRIWIICGFADANPSGRYWERVSAPKGSKCFR